jgi:1-acyl-sn-glycerol-3-phosphate acyltransferase
LRAAFRFLIVLGSFVAIGIRFGLLCAQRGSHLSLEDRAHWLQTSCATILRRMGVRLECRGARPTRGLICSNHLSYLDILAYAAATPCVFVSRSDVRRWPVFGWCARWSGTIFIDRQSRASTEAVARQMGEALDAGVPILLFPEGTSTDGSSILRFHPSLLRAAIDPADEITAAAIAWRVQGGEERDICWYGDASFVPHLLRTLGRAGIESQVEFHPDRTIYTERKAAALDLHEKVQAMRIRMTRGTR